MGGDRAQEQRVSTSSNESVEWARLGGAQVSDHAPALNLPCSQLGGRIMDWNFDALQVDSETGGNSLVWVTGEVFRYNESIIEARVANVFLEIFAKAQSGYNATALARQTIRPMYHNQIHGADVCQATHYLVQKSDLLNRIPYTSQLYGKSDILLYAIVFASAMHDFDHFGVSNEFLIRHKDPLAILYNDKSVMENHHTASAFTLIQGTDLGLSRDNFKIFRHVVIELILSTDMHHHYELMSHGVPNPETDFMHCLKMALHCADVSSGARPLDICIKWTKLIMNEFFHQGDLERSLCPTATLPPMFDRKVANVGKIQSSFYDVIVRPLFVNFEILCANTSLSQTLDENRQWWLSRSNDDWFNV